MNGVQVAKDEGMDGAQVEKDEGWGARSEATKRCEYHGVDLEHRSNVINTPPSL